MSNRVTFLRKYYKSLGIYNEIRTIMLPNTTILLNLNGAYIYVEELWGVSVVGMVCMCAGCAPQALHQLLFLPPWLAERRPVCQCSFSAIGFS